MDVDYKKLGVRISKARNRKGYSQEELAAAINLSREHINLIENARRKPTVDTLIKAANTLGVSADDLLADSLKYASNSDLELQKFLLECNKTEEQILVELIKYMKPVLANLGI